MKLPLLDLAPIKFSKNLILRFSTLMTFVLLFFQFIVLSVWRDFPRIKGVAVFAHANPWGIAVLSAFGLSLWARRLLGPMKKLDHNPRYLLISQGDLLAVVFVGCLSLFFWWMFASPELFRGIHTYGDEDFHFEQTIVVGKYLDHFFKGNWISELPKDLERYPSLMYLLFSIFPTQVLESSTGFFLHRLPLLFPFISVSILVYIVGRLLSLGKGHAILQGALVATSPILLTYTADKYLDIGHPFFSILVCVGVYKSITTNSWRWEIITALAACLISFIRDNTAPTTLIAGITLAALNLLRRPRSYSRAITLALTAIAPFLVFYLFKTQRTTVDSSRLRLTHLFLQNYALFFAFLFLYFPYSFFSLAATRVRARREQLAQLVILLIFFGQLGIYGLFQPGWIPWSRNYLMFFGPISLLSIVGYRQLTHRFSRQTFWLQGILLALCFSQVVLAILEFRKNRVFHENELHFDYPALAKHLNVHPEHCLDSKVYTTFPVGYAGTQGAPSLKDRWVFFETQGGQSSSFQDFLDSSPPGSQCLVYHWYRYRSLLPVLQKPNVTRPSLEELKNVEVLAEFSDPYSEGTVGILLVKKKELGSKRSNLTLQPHSRFH